MQKTIQKANLKSSLSTRHKEMALRCSERKQILLKELERYNLLEKECNEILEPKPL